MDVATVVNVEENTSKWHSSLVTTYSGPLAALQQIIPMFERRAFGSALLRLENNSEPSIKSLPRVPQGFNPYYDVIVRKPLNSEEVEMPVGIVSKQYSLVQHQEIFDEAVAAIKRVGIDPAEVKAELDLSCFGERMRLGLLFPEQFNLTIDNREVMGLRLECFNSVDGSMKFMVVIGWLRFVCANGMVIGIADSYYRRRHNIYMELRDIADILREGIAATTRERDMYLNWMQHKVSDDKLATWSDGYLAKRWGVKAAARAWHITRCGYDVRLADSFEKGSATRKTVIREKMVPGAILPGDTVFAVSQALSWLAKERRDLQDQLEWKRQIPDLIKPLLSRKMN